jgi:hypothetical protein
VFLCSLKKLGSSFEKSSGQHFPYLQETWDPKWPKTNISLNGLEKLNSRYSFVDYYFSLADDVKDLFLEGRLAAIHVTHMGLCLHDFTLSPCKFKLACLSGRGCPEYAFDPSDTKQRTNLVQLVGRTKTALTQATAKAKTTDPALAESWVEDAQSTIVNAERVLSSVPAGENSLVRPFVGQPTKFQAIGNA